MRKTNTLQNIIASLILSMGLGCGPRPSSSFSNAPNANIGQLAVYLDVKMTPEEKFRAQESILRHWTSFGTTFGYPQSAPSSNRRIYVHKTPFLNAPHMNNQKGYTNVVNKDMHIILGYCDTVEDLTHQLAHSYGDPYDVWDQQPNYQYWRLVFSTQNNVVNYLKGQRGCQ